MSRPIKAFWWRWKYPHRLNFGDEITAPLVERITGLPVKWSTLTTCDLVGAGSVLEMVADKSGTNRPVVWGGGFISAPAKDAVPVDLEVRAVRGKRSRARVAAPTEGTIALGDPGLLAPLLVDGTVRKRYALGFIPHYRDAASPLVAQMRALGGDVRIIDVSWTPEEVAREIAACETVVSSSLHGLIFSDALGVPNAHVWLGGKLKGGMYKFTDYYSAFPAPDRYRSYTPPADGPESVHAVVDAVHRTFTPPEGLEDLQNGLVRALGNF